MKITDVRTVLLTGPISDDPFLRACRPRRSAAFIELYTDTDLTGLGETYAGYFCPEIVPSVVEFYKPILVGQSPDDVETLWQRMYHCGNYWGRVGLAPAIINGLEAALYDLKGKMHGVPVYELLGGCKHDKLPCYATGGPSNYPLDRLAAKFDAYLGEGFRAVKVGTGCFHERDGWHMPQSPAEAAEFEAQKLAFIRKHVGPDVRLMLDGHMGNNPVGAWDLATAQTVMRAVEPFDLFFFEEPLHYTDPWGYAELCRSTEVPIAGGECLTGTYEWRVFSDADSFDIGQPDAAWTGGLGEFVRVAQMLERRGRKIATHSAGAGGALMQNIHAGFACANTAICEILPALGGIHRDIAGDSYRFADGYVYPPEKPGLGITLTDEVKNRYAYVPGGGEFNSVPGKILTD